MVRREVSLPSFFLFCGGVAFLATALSTQYWLTSKPRKVDSKKNIYNGTAHFGLFKGVKVLEQPLSNPYRLHLTVVCSSSGSVCMFSDKTTSQERTQDLLLNLKLLANSTQEDEVHLLGLASWATTVVFVALALLVGLVGAVFAVINSVMTPLDFITGLNGLYVWSAAGAFFSLLAMIVWGSAFESVLKSNVMTVLDVQEGWTSSEVSVLGHSFWFVLVAALLYTSNVACVVLLLRKPWRRKGPNTPMKPNAGSKSQDEMMY